MPIGDIGIFADRTDLGDLFDFEVESKDLKTDEGLRTAVIISLFSDARASVEDVESDQDRRGWWADALSSIQGDRTGSKLWLLDRAKQSNETRTRAEEYAAEALDWMIDDGVALRIDTEATWAVGGFLVLKVTITRPTGQIVNYTFDRAWQAEERR